MPATKNIFILGGTALARQLARVLVQQGHAVTTALAGRTQNPVLPEGNVQIGALGGPTGLREKLDAMAVDILVDATHPFAAQISQNAFDAVKNSSINLARLQTLPWPNADNWITCATYADATDALPESARVLLTIGRQNLHHFTPRTDCTFIARMIEAPPLTLPGNFTPHFARPPFTLEDEQQLMRDHKITHLVTKNAGGTTTQTKLDAAKNLGIAVLMIARPTLPQVRTFNNYETLTDWLKTI